MSKRSRKSCTKMPWFTLVLAIFQTASKNGFAKKVHPTIIILFLFVSDSNQHAYIILMIQILGNASTGVIVLLLVMYEYILIFSSEKRRIFINMWVPEFDQSKARLYLTGLGSFSSANGRVYFMTRRDFDDKLLYSSILLTPFHPSYLKRHMRFPSFWRDAS